MQLTTPNSQRTRASIVTYLGVEFFPIAPRFEDIWLADLAHHLSQMCRYNGATVRFYSVAQHSVLVSRFVEQLARQDPETTGDAEMLARWGLMHDASEAYVPDICSPIKRFFHPFQEVEEQLLMAVAQRFELPWPVPAVVKYADKAVFASEKESGITREVDWWQIDPEHPNAGMDVVPLDQLAAERMFLERFVELFGLDEYRRTERPAGPR